MQNGRGLISRIDKRAALLAAATIAIQCATYWLAQLIIKTAGLALHSPETWLDAHIPFLPVFLVPYVGCFAHWMITFYIVYKTKDGFARLFTAAVMGYVIATAIFLIWPHHDFPPRGAGGWHMGIHIRNNLRNGCSAQSVPQRALLRFVSVHDIYREKLWHTPLVRWLSAVMFALVCMATVFVKQHFIIDVAGGTALGALCWAAAAKGKPRECAARVYEALNLHK